MYPYHNEIKRRIKNGELVGFEFVENWPKIGNCMLLRFSTLPALRPVRPKRFAEYAPILKAWAERNFIEATADSKSYGRKLGEIEPGDTFKVGKHEFVVLEHCAGQTAVILKGILRSMAFGSTNNFDGAEVDKVCGAFADEVAGLAGEENLLLHSVDLTSDDGLKDYGEVNRKASLLTTEQYRKYVQILDKHKLNKWWWLATPHSTPTHEDDDWVLCVSPLGGVGNNRCSGGGGVRPFCIFKSSIFVS